MKRVAIFGEVFSQNLGDGAIFDSLKWLLAMRGLTSVPADLSGRRSWLSSATPPVGDSEIGVLRRIGRIPLRRSALLRRSHRAWKWYSRDRLGASEEWSAKIASSDAVIIGGGQLLTDIDFGFPPKIFEVAKLAQQYGKPFAIFGCGAGKRWGLAATGMYRDVLRSARYVSARDHSSAEVLRSYASGPLEIDVHPDPGFVFGRAMSLHTSVAERRAIGINLQPAHHFRMFVPALRGMSDDTYIKFWLNLIRDAHIAGEKIIVLSNGDPKDHEQAVKVVSILSSAGVHVKLNARPLRPEHIGAQIAEISALVCTRMHAGIVAYGMGRNVIPISWDPKVEAVWDAVGQRSRVLPSSILLEENPWPVFSKAIGHGPGDTAHMDFIFDELNAAMTRCLEALGVKC